jgi:hypothetical protein
MTTEHRPFLTAIYLREACGSSLGIGKDVIAVIPVL